MINLIPPVAKRAMLREYWQRVGVVWLLLLSLCIVLAALLTAPSFVLVQSQLSAYELQLQAAATAVSEQDALAAQVTLANTQATTVLAAGEVPRMSPYLEQLQQLTGSGISLTQIDVVRVERVITELAVVGTALNRESLTQFSARIEEDERFGEATVPLESLAANEDIAFTLRIAVTPEA